MEKQKTLAKVVRRPFFYPTLIVVLCILLAEYFEWDLPFHRSQLKEFENQGVTMQGTVEKALPSRRNQRYVLRILNMEDDKGRYECSEKILLTTLYKSDFEPGDRLTFQSKLKSFEENTNDGLFNPKLYFRSQGLHMRAVLKEGDLLSQRRMPGISDILRAKFRNFVIRHTGEILPDEDAKFIQAIILAENSLPEDGLQKEFRRLGLAHLLCVSGLHVGILLTGILFFMKRLCIPPRLSAVTAGLLTWIYAFLLGFPIPVLRAAIMATLYLIAFQIREPYDMENACWFSALFILIFHPYQLFSVGFQLSFIATLSIALLYRPFSELLYPLKRGKAPAALLCAVQAGTLPFTLYYFNYFNPWSFLANLLIAPLFTVVLWLSFGGLAVAGLSVTLALVPGFFLHRTLRFLTAVLHLLDDFSLGAQNVASPTLFLFVLYYAALGLFFFLHRRPPTDQKIIRIALLFLLLLLSEQGVRWFEGRNDLTVTLIDVGQGDAILISSEGKNILLDTGGSPLSKDVIPRSITVPFLKKRGIDRLDALFLSHYDEDHAAGVPALTEEFSIDFCLVPYDSDSEYYRLLQDAGIRLQLSVPGAEWKLTDHTRFLCLDPYGIQVPRELRKGNLSSVLVLEHFRQKMLFTGDMEREQELGILEKIPDVDVLKVGHHGSKTSTTDELLKKSLPELAVISVGRNNSYGHPSDEVLHRLEQAKISVLRTDLNGEIRLCFNEHGIRYSDFRSRNKVDLSSLFIPAFFIGIFCLEVKNYCRLQEAQHGL